MPTNEIISYPFDPQGTSALNKVIGEQQTITSVNFRDYHYIIPRWAPFFAASLQIAFNNPDGSTRILHEGVDYYLGYEFIDASKACAKPIYGAIQFLSTDLAGVVTITYQTVGGTWTLDTSQIAEILANDLYNPRTTSWETVVERPIDFPVIDHEWDLVDMVGASEIVESIDGVRDAINSGNGGGLAQHIADKGNPHDVTALQVGLGNVQNFPIATVAQATAGTNNTTYMTPALVAQAVTALGQANLTAHINNLNNPHQVTKTQVGLSNVPNFAMATSAEALAGTRTDAFMSPALTAAVVAVVNTALNAHTTNQLNPHNTTKDQIVLANVQNYGIATSQQAIAGTDNASYMTPLRTAQAISALASVGLNAHLSDYTNPHQTTKGQVGLGLVQNFGLADQTMALDSANLTSYMTPMRVWQSIEFYVGNDFLTHINAQNPHGTNKADVGLGNVQNYAMATTSDAQTGTATNLYMSPARTTDAITFQVGTAFAAHIAQTNPHGTTKADVGLGLVQNFPIATDAEAQAGASTTTFLTPHGAMLLLSGNLGGHITDYNNPHQTTAAQVGLSLVQNYGIASTGDAQAGSRNDVYMTPLTTKAAAQVIVNDHSSRQDNPHVVTKAQVGLGNVQNFALATTNQAQTGTDNATYMTPALTAAAITVQGTALLNTHALRTDNPHATTAAQVGAYSTSQIDQQMLAKLGVADTAANSQQLGGYTVAGLQSLFTQSSVNGGFMDAQVVDPANTTPYTWAKLGTQTAMTNSNLANAKPDLIWLISGGEDPAALVSPSYRLTLSIRDTLANGYVKYTLTPEGPEPTSGAPEFGFTYDAPTGLATVFVRMGTSSNPMTIVELNHGGGGISMTFLGWQTPPTPTMMTKSASNATLQAQVNAQQAQINQLISDVADMVAGLNNATAALNALN